jgi:hypothetical protein
MTNYEDKPDPYEFEFKCNDCDCVWSVNTRSVPFEERVSYLYNQVCPGCGGVDVGESEDSVNDYE